MKILKESVFINSPDISLEIYGLDLAHFPSAPGLVWQAALKKAKQIYIFNQYLYVISGQKRY